MYIVSADDLIIGLKLSSPKNLHYVKYFSILFMLVPSALVLRLIWTSCRSFSRSLSRFLGRPLRYPL